MISFKRIWGMAKKEAIQIKRDKVALRIPLVMPIAWLFLLSFAFIVIPTNLKLTIVDEMDNTVSSTIIENIRESDHIVSEVADKEDSDGNTLIIEADGKLDLKLNGIDLINARSLEGEVKKALMTSDTMDVEYSYDILNNTNLFVIPGIIGLVLQNIITFLTSISIVKEKEKGTYNQLLFSPINFFEIIVGKIIPYFAIGLFDLYILSILATFFFDVDALSVLLPYSAAGILFILSSLMLGILISSISSNQMQALLYTIFLLLPSILVSDFVFPVESMPTFLKVISTMMPLTHFNRLSRGILVQHESLLQLWHPMLALTIIMVVTITLSIGVLMKNRRT